MRWSIRNQILVAVSLLLLLAVAGTAAATALLAARRSDAERLRELQRLVQTLGDAQFPYTGSVLQKMHGLSGAEFVAQGASGQIAASTLPAKIEPANLLGAAPDATTFMHLSEFPITMLAGRSYFAARVRGNGAAGVHSLYILYPVQSWQEARWDAMWPPLAVGSVAFVLAFAVSAWLAHRSAARIGLVRELFSKLVAQQFPTVPAQPPHDEIYDLQIAANQLSARLAGMQEGIRRTERLRLLAQLAGGLAHQLRNAATGARMALQLHQRRCPSPAHEESLAVALRQLTLMETQISGLLSLGHPTQRSSQPGNLQEILSEMERLLQPVCRHAKVDFSIAVAMSREDADVSDSDEIRAALLNLALNAIEAAGAGGRARIEAESEDGHVRIRVIDSGSGPPSSLRESLFEPFATSKPEGVGLGLALAQQAAVRRGGSLTWSREAECTTFVMTWPVDRVSADRDPPDPCPVHAPASLQQL